MIKLYLDWNVINGMRTCTEVDELLSLRKYIEKNRSYFEIYYSQAHLSDLAGQRYLFDDTIKEDLEYLSKLTENKALVIKNDIVDIQSISPLDWYQTIIEDHKILNVDSFDDLLKIISTDCPETKPLIDNYIRVLKSTLLPSIPKQFEQLIPDIAGKTCYDAFNAIFKLSKSWMQTDAYSKVRNLIQSLLNFKTSTLSSTTKPFIDISKSFENLGSSVTYENIEQTVEKSFISKTPVWYNNIISTYLNLDMYGYSQDEISIKDNKKKTFQNTANDAIHAAYASVCHFFIIQDKKARRKTEATYNHLEINTTVLNPVRKKENSSYIYFISNEYIVSPQTVKDLYQSILKTIDIGTILKETANDGTQVIFSVYSTSIYYGFFNKIIIIPEEKSFQIALAFKKPTNCPMINLVSVVKLANQLISLFGIPNCGTKQVELSHFDAFRANQNSNWTLYWQDAFLIVFSGGVQFYFPWIPLENTEPKNPQTN